MKKYVKPKAKAIVIEGDMLLISDSLHGTEGHGLFAPRRDESPESSNEELDRSEGMGIFGN